MEQATPNRPRTWAAAATAIGAIVVIVVLVALQGERFRDVESRAVAGTPARASPPGKP